MQWFQKMEDKHQLAKHKGHVTSYKPFIKSHIKYCCAVWCHRIYHKFNLILLESTKTGGTLSHIL